MSEVAAAPRDGGPVFIVGALRSGTTLLRLMLDHHPELCIFNEFEYAVQWIDEDGPPPLDDYYRNLRADRMFRAQGFEIDGSLDYHELVRSFLRQATERSGKELGGATVHSNFQYLHRFWPDARYIHLVRDPRDVARSCIGMRWVGNVYHGSRYWVEPILRWNEFEPTLAPGQWHQVRYEELIQDPVAELTKICDFVGIPFDGSMLEYPATTTYSFPDPSLVEQWRTKLSKEEIRWVESVCAPWMERFGYVPVHSSIQPPSMATAARLAIQNRSSRIRRNIEVYGLPLYVSWQLTKRLPENPLQERVLRRKFEIDTSRLK